MGKSLKIVADENMPHIDALFGDFAELVKRPGRAMSSADVIDADALICRSITRVNELLLGDSKVSFVGTATIGTDHLDIDWLESHNIRWASAPGCNAAAVAQYVMSAIAYWLRKNKKVLSDITVGIVGAGNVGSALARCLQQLGVKFCLCDPPLARQGEPRAMVSMSQILACDVISLHVPLNRQGQDRTFHLFDTEVLQRLSPGQLLINASRGAVVDNTALLNYLSSRSPASVVLDVFEGEPQIDMTLASRCLLATPHIAGHTLEGKSRGSFQIYQALCQHFKIPQSKTFDELLPQNNRLKASANPLDTLLQIYPIKNDSNRLLHKCRSQQDVQTVATHFDELRKDYLVESESIVRRDYSGWSVTGHFPSFELFN